MPHPAREDLSVRRYAESAARRFRVTWADGLPWLLERRMIEPAVPPHLMRPVRRTAVRRAMRETGALIARWNEAWDTPPCEWWWVCCDDPDYDMAGFKKKVRYYVRLGLQNCEIRRVPADWFAANAFPVYRAAFARYRTPPAVRSEEEFARAVLAVAHYPGRHYWGAFVEGRLAAYASCIVIEDAVYLSGAKSDPEFHKYCPNNALFYELTRSYLRDEGLRYVTDGTRVVRHDTDMQGFLERMGYRRIYCPLKIELHPALRAALRLGVPALARWCRLQRLAPRLDEQIRALELTAQIAESCRCDEDAHGGTGIES